jgi:hypothetical protein
LRDYRCKLLQRCAGYLEYPFQNRTSIVVLATEHIRSKNERY